MSKRSESSKLSNRQRSQPADRRISECLVLFSSGRICPTGWNPAAFCQLRLTTAGQFDHNWLALFVADCLFQSRWLFNASFHHANHANHPYWKKTNTHTHHLLLPTKNLLQKFLILSHHSDLENPELTQDVMIQIATFRWHQLVTVANPSWMFFFPWQLLVACRRGRQFNSHALTEVFETLFFTLQTSRIAEGTAAKRIEYE